MHPAKLIIVFCCHINELFEKPLSGKVRTKVIGKRLIEYDAKENTRENFESYSQKKCFLSIHPLFPFGLKAIQTTSLFIISVEDIL